MTSCTARDHPRMCGEHFLSLSYSVSRAGSSPHVRGARFRTAHVVQVVGIIPACAGSTLAHLPVWTLPRDHPRMCGEHKVHPTMKPVELGSSPHVRGALKQDVARLRIAGIIPACAGSTCWARTRTAGSRDHPRMCGEHAPYAPSISQNRGSSPHVRGARSLPGPCA